MNAHAKQALIESYDKIDISDFNEQDRSIIDTLLQQAITDALPFNGEYKADWLLEGGLGDPKWVTQDGKKTRFVNGKHEKTCNVYFDRVQIDGTNLLDEENSILLEAIQKSAFLLRIGLFDAKLNPRSWMVSVNWLISLSNWATLHGEMLKPKVYGFSLINQNFVNLLYQQLSVGGWIEALDVVRQILSHLYLSATGHKISNGILEKPFEVPDKECQKIVGYLKENSMYALDNPRSVSRNAIANILHLNQKSLRVARISVFLRQFEPELQHPYLLVSDTVSTEFPSQNTPFMSEAISKTIAGKTFNQHRFCFQNFIPAYRHLPQFFPDSRVVDVQMAYELSKHQTYPDNHHNLIPMDTGLSFLNESMRWVIVYGDAIVDGTLEMTKHIQSINSTEAFSVVKVEKKHKAFNEIIPGLKTKALPSASSRPLTEAINLSCYLRKNVNKSFDVFRQEPSLMDALEVLVGACIISIAMLKPSREEEIWSLNRNCVVKHQSGNGESWWLKFDLGKSGSIGINQETQKPIPSFTAKAIGLLQRLGEGLRQIYSDDSTYATEDLFYLPASSFTKPADKGFKRRGNYCLNRFCDYINLPTDQYERRWYVRIHEMRKWFLLMMFWHCRYGVLDAVRWIAGHTDAKHTYAYIEANFSGEELPKLEAQCVDEKLIELERGNIKEGDSNLVALYDSVCKHFGVNKIEGIRGIDFIEYLEDLREDEIYHVEPYSILSENGQEVVGIEIAVKFSVKE